jgi:hypothetical protein
MTADRGGKNAARSLARSDRFPADFIPTDRGGIENLEINMWQFAPDRRMVIPPSPRHAITTLKENAIVSDETSAAFLRASPKTMSHG